MTTPCVEMTETSSEATLLVEQVWWNVRKLNSTSVLLKQTQAFLLLCYLCGCEFHQADKPSTL